MYECIVYKCSKLKNFAPKILLCAGLIVLSIRNANIVFVRTAVRIRIFEFFFSYSFGQLADNEFVRLFYQCHHEFWLKLLIEDVAPVFLVPMKGRSDGFVLFAQFLVSLRTQLACESPHPVPHLISSASQPKAKKDFAFNAEGDVVVAKRLVFCHVE